ncbi:MULTISPECIES: general stress protein [unclassified Staphylococcus]|uniref:general stress protein n=1 Tax=unclassified Staphylococcus TaxID=91994 RepID=UPI0021D0C21B|nr:MULTISPECIES: general stress protein [unclassified Staphylococcus]UXR76205.1 general stress protein [Staphylococcus sp. IVB6233]UXR80402.1 general stress protein [Staphylococcus sp. IVB6218]
MTHFKVVKSEEAAIEAVNTLLGDGYKEHEITIISKDRLSTDRFNDSEVKQTPTAGTISDKFMRFFIGEDSEEAAFTRFNLADNDKAQLKQAVLDGDIVILVSHFESGNHSEVSQTNSSYETQEFKHHPSEHKGGIE